jgi:hypothetical protein
MRASRFATESVIVDRSESLSLIFASFASISGSIAAPLSIAFRRVSFVCLNSLKSR